MDKLDLDKPGFILVHHRDLGRPGCDTRMMLTHPIYGYLNRTPSSRRLEREFVSNVPLIAGLLQICPELRDLD